MEFFRLLATRAFVFAASVLSPGIYVLAAPLTPGNILVSELDSGSVIEYTPGGMHVQFVTFGHPGMRDIVVGSSGEVHIFNAPTLLTVTPSDGAVVNRTVTDWSVGPSRTSRGGIGEVGRYVFLTDTDTGSADKASGLIRFDLKSGNNIRIADGRDYHDLSIGGDGFLYGLQDNGWFIDVFDPYSLQEIRSISLEFDLRVAGIRSIAVDAKGTIYAAPWGRNEIYAVNQSGFRIDSMITFGIASYSDLDLDSSGRLLLGNWDGDVIMTDVNLDSYTRFVTNNNPYVSRKMIHVAFTSPLVVVPEPAAFCLLISAGVLLTGRSRRRSSSYSRGRRPSATTAPPSAISNVRR